MTQSEIFKRVSEINQEMRELRRPHFKRLTEKYKHIPDQFKKMQLRTEELRPIMQEIESRFEKELSQLRLMCALHGHSGNNIHDNGLGYRWSYCSVCGERYNIINLNEGTNNV